MMVRSIVGENSFKMGVAVVREKEGGMEVMYMCAII